MFRKHAKVATTAGAFSLLLSPALAHAQEETGSAPVLEQVTVTAQKRTENVQSVPIAITAFSASQLESKGLSNVSELGDFSPNVGIDSTSSFSGSTQVLSAFIRGIGQSDFAFNLDPGVGIYVDGVYYARTIGSVVDLLDVDHIEVLKGPQGTLFGRNTIGGAISVVTRRPSDEFQVKGELTGGQYNRLDVRGVADIPLIKDTLLAQVAFSAKNRSGYFSQNVLPGNYVTDVDKFTRGDSTTYASAGGESNQTARGKILWLPTDNTRVTLTGDYTHVDDEPTPSVLLAVKSGAVDIYNACISTSVADLIGGPFEQVCLSPRNGVGGDLTPLGGANVDSNPYNDRLVFDNSLRSSGKDHAYATGAGYSKVDVWGAALTAEIDLTDLIVLRSITAYRSLDADFAMDVDGTPVPMGDHGFAMDQRQISEEIQLTGDSLNYRLKWVAGFYGFHEEGSLHDYVHFVGGLLQIDGPNEFDTSAYAAFAQLSYSITEQFGVTVGGRYTREEKEFLGAQRDLNSFAFKMGFPLNLHPDRTDTTLYFPPTRNERSFSNFSGKLGFDYHFNDDAMAYLSYSEGFKSGGWTTRATVPILEAPTFDPETAETYELGIKSQFLARRMQANLALFLTEYNDLQVTVYSGISPVTENAAQSEIKGAELELQALATDSLTLAATLGYIDAAYKELQPGTALQEDFLFLNTPEWSASASAEYVVPLGGFEMVAHADYAYRGKTANDAENTPELMADAVGLVGAALTVRKPSGDWRVTIGGRNLTDERYIVAGQAQSGIGYIGGTYSRPREWYVTVGYSL